MSTTPSVGRPSVEERLDALERRVDALYVLLGQLTSRVWHNEQALYRIAPAIPITPGPTEVASDGVVP